MDFVLDSYSLSIGSSFVIALSTLSIFFTVTCEIELNDSIEERSAEGSYRNANDLIVRSADVLQEPRACLVGAVHLLKTFCFRFRGPLSSSGSSGKININIPFYFIYSLFTQS